MRPGQNKRMRGRNNNNNNGGNRRGPNPLTRSYESNGPDVKIRGNAHHVAEKYLQLARDAQSSGDPVGAESYLQHAEHYFRLIASYQQTQQVGYNRQAEEADDDSDEDSGIPDRFASPQAPTPSVPQQPPAQPQPQPYQGERQQPSYGDRNQGGDRQAYADRNNGYGQRQDRHGQNGQRRPYRDDRFNEARNGDGRAGGEVRGGGDGRNGEYRNNNERRNGYERMQERAQQQERFNNERAFREPQPDQPREFYGGEQPRPADQQARTERFEAEQPIARTEPIARVEPQPRAEPAPRTVPEDAPGLPSFITTPTRTVAAEPVAGPVGEAVPAFPGDAATDAPKFPRRRRRTVRPAAVEGDEAPAEQPAGD